jgi:hypothetical protein
MKSCASVLMATALVFVMGMLSGCASPWMKPTQVINPSPNYAVVNFLRPSWIVGRIDFWVWDQDDLVGVLTSNNYIQYKAVPGEHIFIVDAWNSVAIKANVVAGKSYYVRATSRMSWAGLTNVFLEVLKPDDTRIDAWLASLKPIALDTTRWDVEMKKCESDSSSQITQQACNLQNKLHQDIVTGVQNGKIAFLLMNPEDGR